MTILNISDLNQFQFIFRQNMDPVVQEIEIKDKDKNHDMEPSIDLSEPEPQSAVLKWAERNIGENPNTKLELIEEFRDMIFGTNQPICLLQMLKLLCFRKRGMRTCKDR